MPLTIFSDGTQVFGVPDSPVTINSITYIAEDLTVTQPSTVVEIKDGDGIVIGQTIIPGPKTVTGKLQLAASSTAVPTVGLTMTLGGDTYYLTEVGEATSQGQYASVNFSAKQKIN